jgi:hypothetical protein
MIYWRKGQSSSRSGLPASNSDEKVDRLKNLLTVFLFSFLPFEADGGLFPIAHHLAPLEKW